MSRYYYLINTMHSTGPNDLGLVVSRHTSRYNAERARKQYKARVRRTEGAGTCIPLAVIDPSDFVVERGASLMVIR